MYINYKQLNYKLELALGVKLHLTNFDWLCQVYELCLCATYYSQNKKVLTDFRRHISGNILM